MQKKDFVSGIILASGFSRRAKCDKLLLEWKGKSLLFESIKNALFSSLEEVLLIIQPKHEDICKQYLSLFSPKLTSKVKVIINTQADEGMSSSLKLGVQNLDTRSTASLFILADQVFFDAQEIDRICDCYKKIKAPIIAPYYNNKRKNPVLFSSAYNEELLKVNEDKGAREVLLEHEEDIYKIYYDNNILFEDIDTQEQYASMRKKLFTWYDFLINYKSIALIGAGGKTSLLWNIVEELNSKGEECLVSTTTKMWNFAPKNINIELLSHIDDLEKKKIKKTTLIASSVNQENKLVGFDTKFFDRLNLQDFENIGKILIEADGAKGRSFKIHAKHEPCIPQSCKLVVAVVGMDAIGKNIEEYVHRYELSPYSSRKMTLSLLIKLLFMENGYFLHCKAFPNLLFLNCKESKIAYKKALKLIEFFKTHKNIQEILIKQTNFKGIVYGSNKLKDYTFIPF